MVWWLRKSVGSHRVCSPYSPSVWVLYIDENKHGAKTQPLGGFSLNKNGCAEGSEI
jgi:hypothetical protein